MRSKIWILTCFFDRVNSTCVRMAPSERKRSASKYYWGWTMKLWPWEMNFEGQSNKNSLKMAQKWFSSSFWELREVQNPSIEWGAIKKAKMLLKAMGGAKTFQIRRGRAINAWRWTWKPRKSKNTPKSDTLKPWKLSKLINLSQNGHWEPCKGLGLRQNCTEKRKKG